MIKGFGIYPETHEPKMWWGARAIATDRKYGIDIPWDRQNFEGDREHPDKDEFFHWLNKVAIPELDRRFKKYESTKAISFDSENGCFHCEAADRDSYGYLYIGAWTTEAMDKEAK